MQVFILETEAQKVVLISPVSYHILWPLTHMFAGFQSSSY